MYPLAKRFCDVIASVALLLLFWPVLLLIAALIVLESGRPVLFRQVRSGKNGQPFVILKFRTLRSGTHDSGQPLLMATRVGRVLRRWGLDELPQLWNIVRGEMSLVGPRPTKPEQVDCYGSFERQRLAVPPGLTGWAQVHGRNALSWPERIELDVWYVEHRSLWLDLRILWRTPRVLFSGDGLYGEDGRNPGFSSASRRSAAHG